MKKHMALEVGMNVIRMPETIYTTDDQGIIKRRPIQGFVTYVHPKGRYHIVAFHLNGRIIKESFPGVSVIDPAC